VSHDYDQPLVHKTIILWARAVSCPYVGRVRARNFHAPTRARAGGRIDIGTGRIDLGKGRVDVGKGRIDIGKGRIDIGKGRERSEQDRG
jgi:hypothetical protein